MAKAKKITGPTTINITKKTKDTTYIIDESAVGTAQVNFHIFTQVHLCHIVPLKNSDDLCLLIPNYIDESTNILKYAVITIKDYYKYCETNNDLILLGNDSVYEDAKKEKDDGSYFTPDKKIEGEMISNIAGGRKNTTYNITQATKANKTIFDIAGNDKYTLSAPYSEEAGNMVNIGDYLGHDKYTLTNGSCAVIQDVIGKDDYTIKENSSARIIDFNGNDKYTIENATETLIQDRAGKDKYTVSGAEQFAIYDMAGNDTYKLTNVQTTDEHGIIDPNNTLVGDKVGNDKYTVSGSDTYLLINDKSGKDTYNIKGAYDKKTKTATYVGHTEIKDEGLGKNTFNVNYGEYTRINTQSNINTFNIKNSDFTYIGANIENNPVGKDTYNLDTNADFTIYDYGASGDSYTLKKSNYGYVCDYNGNDKYTISDMVFNPKITEDEILAGISIDDRGGTNDTLTLKTTKKDNIVYMSDFGKQDDKYRSWGNSLIIYDKSTQGFVEISNFYSANENYDFTGFGNGVIETIKASKKKLDVSTNAETMAYLDSIKEDVVEWLVGENNQGVDFSSVDEVLIYGTDDQKATLVSYFDGSHYAG